ncbi:cystathionine gamma-lyase [Archangium gephyra]|uniref:Cystathionine gamma-lyase n=1 Tax=Archangium gephyra TaxID=48 RepID=A0AAC8QF49_9BACT|nr:cystathionine gamma-synthase [Archangium gephyra]AKJ06319.1 Cystathionine gamma-lyase [Archangium gephyra]REG32363.1 cystathionine gamma-lyase [Archangium gephyra]HYO70483.1 cystathionine gamma-synthase [Archangium sp.]
MRFDTLAIHAGQEPDPTTGAIMTPVYLTSTYVQAGPGEHKGFEYSRTQNPTRNALQDCLAALEGAKHGLAFASGLAGSDMLMHMLESGDHVVVSDDVYGGTFRIFDKVFRRHGLNFSWVDLSNPDNFEKAITPKTKMVWVESPTNPMLKLIDLPRIAETAKKRNILSVCDNTFMTPYFQRPMDLGFDVVTHSTTKYINGHSDVVGGFVCTSNDELAQKMYFLQNAVGGVPGPMDCFLVLRGVKTLGVRMERHAQNALKVAQFLATHPKVQKVTYPGLESHPQHALARKQMKGFGGMMTFDIKGGLEAARKFLKTVKIFACAESLGGVESLIEHPAIMTHASVPKETRELLGISDGLIRLSVGIEDAQDLVDDLKQALDVA